MQYMGQRGCLHLWLWYLVMLHSRKGGRGWKGQREAWQNVWRMTDMTENEGMKPSREESSRGEERRGKGGGCRAQVDKEWACVQLHKTTHGAEGYTFIMPPTSRQWGSWSKGCISHLITSFTVRSCKQTKGSGAFLTSDQTHALPPTGECGQQPGKSRSRGSLWAQGLGVHPLGQEAEDVAYE